MKIGLLQCGLIPEELTSDHKEYPGMFRDLLGTEAFDYIEYAVVNNELPASPEEADGWLVTGSRHGAYEDHEWIPPLEDFLRKTYSKNIPIAGICFGHQILAQALGGKVEKFTEGWSVGPVTYSLDDGNTLNVIAWHQDQVTQLPEDAETFGSTAFCQHAFVRYGNKAITIQPHPEFHPSFLHGLLRTRGQVLPNDIRQQAFDADCSQLSTIKIGTMLREFFLDHAENTAAEKTTTANHDARSTGP